MTGDRVASSNPKWNSDLNESSRRKDCFRSLTEQHCVDAQPAGEWQRLGIHAEASNPPIIGNVTCQHLAQPHGLKCALQNHLSWCFPSTAL